MIKHYAMSFLVIIFHVTTINALPHLVLMGPPGAGKGTFTDKLVQTYNYIQICPGALLRAEAEKESALGLQIKPLVESGRPIDPKIVWHVVLHYLNDALLKNIPFVLDGYPKNKECFDYLMSFLQERNITVQFIHFYADDAVCFDRMVSRLECHACGATFNKISKPPMRNGVCDNCQNCLVQRKGDDLITARYRLEEFHQNIEPLINEIKTLVPVLEVDTSWLSIDHCNLLCKKIIE